MTNIPLKGDVFTEKSHFFDFLTQKCYSLYLKEKFIL
jgi:hypothetical protein